MKRRNLLLCGLLVFSIFLLAGCTASNNKEADANLSETTNNVEDSKLPEASERNTETETVKETETVIETKQEPMSSNIEDYTIEDIDVFIGNVVIESEYYYGPSEAFEVYKDVSDEMDMGHPMPGQMAIVYGKCKETGWWRLDLGRSGDYPEVYVPENCIEKP